MRELGAAGTFADRPNSRGARFQALIDPDVTRGAHFDAGLCKTDIVGIRDTPEGNEKVAAFDFRSNSVATSASSRPINWRPGSTIVTRLPKRR